MRSQPILAVGSIALDTIHTASERHTDILGGSATFFAVSAASLAQVRLVGVVGDDYPEEGWRLFRDKGVDVSDVQQVAGRTFRWGGEYSKDFSTRETLFTELGVFEDFEPKINAANRDTPIVYLGNIQPSLQLAVCNRVSDQSRIISDTMNLWIDNNRAELTEVIRRSHIFLINDEEAEEFTGISDPEAGASALLEQGPEIVIIKQGGKGALLATSNGRRHIPVYPDVQVLDPTGAGDSFAGGLLCYLSVHGEGSLLDAVINAAATASFTVEGVGLDGLLKADVGSIRKRADVITALMD
ncbi:MAG: sugar kinase [Candidatus Marinimicrobia bacterium]|nr:sugar kinase [Candidatus Neomarinimicrobiota bacterium]